MTDEIHTMDQVRFIYGFVSRMKMEDSNAKHTQYRYASLVPFLPLHYCDYENCRGHWASTYVGRLKVSVRYNDCNAVEKSVIV